MADLTLKQAEKREGFFYALAIDMWPGLRKRDPAAFDRNVRLLYEFSLQTPHTSARDPLNLKAGHYDTPHAALVATEKWLHRPKQGGLLHDLSTGHTSAAADILGVDYASGPKLPAKLHGGYLTADAQSGWSFSVSDGLHGVEHAAKAVGGGVATGAKDVGSAVGDVGGWLKNNVMVIVLVVVLLLIVKK